MSDKVVYSEKKGRNMLSCNIKRPKMYREIAIWPATRELLAKDLTILNQGQVTRTTPELAPPPPSRNYHTNKRMVSWGKAYQNNSTRLPHKDFDSGERMTNWLLIGAENRTSFVIAWSTDGFAEY
ncbi:hypothetical protein TNCV_4655551 [Trichonephila clavipes]|nr:hypothetical protein TNCV_4655551 [Trichonephila clavipes]